MLSTIIICGIGFFSNNGDTIIGRTHYNHVEYFSNQYLEELGHLKKGVPNGYWITFYEDGKNRKVANYKEGVLSGDYFEWYSNGQIKEEGLYKHGRKIGKWTTRDAHGNIIKIDIFDRKGKLKHTIKKTVDKTPNGPSNKTDLFEIA
ncbi:hypothetical protein BH10BAC1_BH10BAC1_08000 [soil metagenome]